ncbi:putative multidrug efflux transporter AcrB transmembrane domain-containing protein [Lyophyllum shimeji]|uniref:Multidrug efflux transporter AcrB transmembrane domain-containing protein n=1 Tax=Lyophyllum shimeji TaxID=47721 RepID=A0A9P3PCR7_LYOSH|nr:putative multidrug efflux transporter AcrB transmembrane domain-containing protein [Lyophyllum shimeji]
MRDSCGKKGFFGKDLPCPYDGPPMEPDDEARLMLVDICGPEFAEGPTCCTKDQVEALRDNFNQVEGLISACPACRNNFRSFFCTFTCSPEQASFVNVTSTQTTRTGQIAVKSVDFHVSEKYGEGFYNSCKDVQVGTTNGYAMELIGGGAKDYHGFFKYMGDEKPIGSPFQINFPSTTPTGLTPLNITPRGCADNDLRSRCTCIDCPSICPTLPAVPPPNAAPTCQVGALSCLSFFLILAYALAVLGFLVGYLVSSTIKKRRERTYERVALSEDTSSPRIHTRGLVGQGSLAQYLDEDSLGTQSESRHLGRGASLLDPIDTAQPRQYPLNTFLRHAFYKLGLFAASNPFLMFSVVFTVMAILNIGWKKFEIETDPVRLWVAPSSESKQRKEFFDANFGPFYRTEQIFVTAAPAAADQTTSLSLGADGESVLSWDRLKYWFKVEEDIRALRSPRGYDLSDVCFKPAGPQGACVVQSVTAWFGNDLDNYDEDTWAEHLDECARSPVECLPDFQQPLGPHYVLGGVPETEDGRKLFVNAEALVITYVVSDSLDSALQARAMEWEQTLRTYLVDLSSRAPNEAGLHVAFSTGVSLEEEINKSTNTDVKIVVLSYLAMFFYVSLTLGAGSAVREEEGVFSSLAQWARNFPGLFKRSSVAVSELSVDTRTVPRFFPRLPRNLFIGSKFMLGLFGIALVILSVSSSVGFFSWIGVKVTLIIAEVIPFLVLAVGVDNVFILVHELDRQNFLHGPNAAVPVSNGGFTTPMSPTHSHRSPYDSSLTDDLDAASMPQYLSAEERVARTLAKMGPSILLSTITETVAFSLGALVPMPAVRNFALYAAGSVLLNAILQVTVFVSALCLDLKRLEAGRVDCFPCIRLQSRIALLEGSASGSGLGRIGRFIRRHYAPFLLKPVVKGIVMIIFTGAFIASVISMQHIELGLDQRLALPSESYLVDYFDNLDAYLDVGPPVYFVSRSIDVTQRPGQQALCGRFTTCQDFSVANVLEAERKRPKASFISEPSASWIDDFFLWLDPNKEECCRVRKSDPSIFCTDRDSPRLCRPCYKDKTPAWNITMEGLPEDEEFMRYVKQWLVSPTTEECPLAGKASFGTALSISQDGTDVVASHFRTFHAPLKSQADFVNAFASAHRVADDISQRTGADVFPYSMFYVFFDQYAHIVAITQEVLGLGLASVLVVTALLLGSWRTGSIVTGVVGLTVITVMGVMPLWGISLNAISLVNLVISLGIAVEFCAHIARAFMSAGTGLPVEHPAGQKERDERMWTALVDVGPSVLSGITFTKLIGMSVLALTRSKLLEIYYFRMWVTLIISGALHGLVLLPVVLSIAGGSGFPQQEADEEWMSRAIRNDYEYAPFLADDESVASD